MTNIRVNPNDLQQLASTLDAQMREMDSAIRHAYDQVTNISDSAKGLNDVRNRARDLYRQHVAQVADGTEVARFVKDTAQRFIDTERELSSMMGVSKPQPLHEFLQNISIAGVTIGAVLPFARIVVDGMQQGIKDWNKIYTDANKYAGYLKDVSDFLDDPDTMFGHVMHGVNIASEAFQDKLNTVNGYVGVIAKGVKYGDVLLKGVETGDWSGLRNLAVDDASRLLVSAGLKYAASLVPGVGTVLLVSDGIQLVGKGIASGLEFIGLKDQADGVRKVLEVIDLREQAVKATKWVANQVIDGVSYIVQNPHEAMKQATDFVNHTTDQVKNAANQLYQGATDWWKSKFG
jgi:hypothetical protein